MPELNQATIIEILGELEKRGLFKTIIFNEANGAKEIKAIIPTKPMRLKGTDFKQEEE
jgi:hypothetical protein